MELTGVGEGLVGEVVVLRADRPHEKEEVLNLFALSQDSLNLVELV